MADTLIEPNLAGALPPVSVAALLESAMRARKSGNLAASRALLRALATQQPDLPRVWLLLATVAETRAEQRHALEQVLALDPHSEPAQRGLARMSAVEAAPAAAAATTNGQQRDHDLRLPAMATAGAAALASAQPAASVRAPDGGAAPAAFAPGEYAEATHTAPGLRSADIAPAQAYHRVLVDHEPVHLKDRAVDPLEGALSNLFDIGGKTSRRHADAIEEQLLETIKE